MYSIHVLSLNTVTGYGTITLRRMQYGENSLAHLGHDLVSHLKAQLVRALACHESVEQCLVVETKHTDSTDRAGGTWGK